MKIIVVGMPQSGRTTVAKALCKDEKYRYIDASSWVKSAFRDPKSGEHPQQYHDEYHRWFTSLLKVSPQICTNKVTDCIKAYQEDNLDFIIDSVVSPKDFIHLFDYNQDVVLFLNRTDTEVEYKDYESIGVSVMRDYCFWLASAGLLARDKWYEYNFKIPGEESEVVKSLGSKNSVYIVKSLNKVISHFKDRLVSLQGPQS